MDTISTITERGQVVIPVAIRQHLGLKPSDKLFFQLDDGKIIAQPLLSIQQAMGVIKTHKRHTKKEYKKAILKAVAQKHQKS